MSLPIEAVPALIHFAGKSVVNMFVLMFNQLCICVVDGISNLTVESFATPWAFGWYCCIIGVISAYAFTKRLDDEKPCRYVVGYFASLVLFSVGANYLSKFVKS